MDSDSESHGSVHSDVGQATGHSGGPPLAGQLMAHSGGRTAGGGTLLERRIAHVRRLTKPQLVEECHSVGVAGNINVAKATLVARLVAFYTDRDRQMRLAAGARRSAEAAVAGLVSRPAPPRGGPGDLPIRSPSRPADRGATDGAGSSSRLEAGGATSEPPAAIRAPSPSPSHSPSPPPGKRPRATAPPFQPITSPRGQGSPHAQRLLPPHRRSIPEPLDARRRSHAAASVRPARLDELLELQSELRRRNVCLRGLADAAAEDAGALEGKVAAAVEQLAGQHVAVDDCVRVGRYNPDRPRPVIVRFAKLEDKLQVLRGKAVLYTAACPEALKGIRVYHDLSTGQLDWKRRLRGAYEYYLGAGIRAVWRRGYRLFVLIDGLWTEFYSDTVLVR